LYQYDVEKEKRKGVKGEYLILKGKVEGRQPQVQLEIVARFRIH